MDGVLGFGFRVYRRKTSGIQEQKLVVFCDFFDFLRFWLFFAKWLDLNLDEAAFVKSFQDPRAARSGDLCFF